MKHLLPLLFLATALQFEATAQLAVVNGEFSSTNDLLWNGKTGTRWKQMVTYADATGGSDYRLQDGSTISAPGSDIAGWWSSTVVSGGVAVGSHFSIGNNGVGGPGDYYAKLNQSGAFGIIQTFHDRKATRGLQLLTFDYTLPTGTGIVFKVFGINETNGTWQAATGDEVYFDLTGNGIWTNANVLMLKNADTDATVEPIAERAIPGTRTGWAPNNRLVFDLGTNGFDWVVVGLALVGDETRSQQVSGGLDNIRIESAGDAYETWASAHHLAEGETGDDDHDGLDNLYECAVGGNPTNAADGGHAETWALIPGSPEWIEHAYPRATHALSGLDYNLYQTADLVPGGWNPANFIQTGTMDLGDGFEMVTNRFEVSAGRQFFRLAIRRGGETISGFANPLDITGGNPNIFKAGDTYYFSSQNARKTSQDLVHWNDKPDWINVSASDVSGLWASSLFEKNGTYHLYFSAKTPITGDLHAICVATATNLNDTFTVAAAPMWWDGYGYIDPFVVDFGGTNYMYYTYQLANGTGDAKVHVAQMKPNMIEIDFATTNFCIQPSEPWESQWQEAVHVMEHEGSYYMVWSTYAFSGPNYRVGYATAPSPTGPWTKAPENPILQQAVLPEGQVLGPGAMSFTESPDGAELLGIYFSHPKINATGPRQMNLDRLHFENNGANPDRLVVDGPTLETQPWPSGATPSSVALGADGFDGSGLDSRWVNVWNGNLDNYSLANGHLAIRPIKGDLTPKAEPDLSDIGYSENIFIQYAPQNASHQSRAHVLLPTATKPVFGYIHYWQDPRNFIMLKLLAGSVKVEQMVDDALTVQTFTPTLSNPIEQLEIIRRTDLGVFQFKIGTADDEWETLPIELIDRFHGSKVLKCGVGAGVEGNSNPSSDKLIMFDEYGLYRL